MLRPLVAALAVFELLAPDRLVGLGERLAFENPERARLRPSTLLMARLEALGVLWIAVRGQFATTGLRAALVVVGLPAVFSPRAYVDAALEVAYENHGEIRLRPGFLPATRILGLASLLVAVFPWSESSDIEATEPDAAIDADPIDRTIRS